MMTLKNQMRMVVIAGLAAAALTTLCGCDLLGLGTIASTLSGLGGYGLNSWYPTGYDATSTIQSANDYRQSVMDNANAAWDEYIRE